MLGSLLVVYGNHFQNGFHFDDTHTIENNAAIRELRNIPLFFRDATTFSSLPTNQSYRPVVSTLIAIDYRLAGGLEPFWFHLSSFVIFVGLTTSLAFVIYWLLERTVSSPRNYWIALITAGWYGLNPANADNVNYVIASADLMSTLAVLASFALYLAFPQLRWYYLYCLPAAVGILAKPTAAIFAVLLAVFLLLFKENIIPARRKGHRVPGRFKDVLPPFVFCGAILLFSHFMTPRTWVSGSASAQNYIITQPYVALLYLRNFFWAGGISADYDLAPFTTINDIRLWTGFAFMTALVAISIATCVCQKTRVIGLGLAWFLIALLPTSLLPLAEVMNDHRALLSYAGIAIAVAGSASLLLDREVRFSIVAKIATASAVLALLIASGYATWQRNKVWKTDESLWRDVVIKSPRNARGLMNYGTALMAKGDLSGASSYFNRALTLAPNYSVLMVNLAIAHAAMNRPVQAEDYFNAALRLAPMTPDSYTYYARFLLSQGRIAEARQLLEIALKYSPTHLSVRALLAQTDDRFLQANATAEFYLALSLQDYNEGRYVESIAASQEALARRPNCPEAWNNIGASYNRLSQFEKGVLACQRALRLKPDFDLAQNNLRYAREMLKP